mgnify:FL=1
MQVVEFGTVLMSNDKSTLSTGKYQIEQTTGAAVIYAQDDHGNKQWIASTSDPMRAMEIVEGLVLVEMKRFYYPESTPTVNSESESKSVPPFLQRKS